MILHRYFARRFFVTFAGVFAVFAAMTVLLDLVEKLRGFSANAEFPQILSLTLLSAPGALYRILPLIMILTTVALFLGLARSSELVVTRAAGRSAIRSLISPLIVATIIGCIGVAVVNPIVAATSKELERRSDELRGRSSTLKISSDGFWLRQGNADRQTVIRALTTNLDGTELQNVTFITFEGGPVQRVEAESARLSDGAWVLSNAKIWPLAETRNPEADALTRGSFSIPSTLTADQIRDSFGAPSSIPIWELPGFISRLETAGFAARRHQMWLQSELAQPLFLLAMVLIGAGFTMRHQRGGRTGMMVLLAIMFSFGLYFLRNFANVLGENGQIPVILAAWAPPLIGIGMSLGFLLHLEDG